MASSTPIQSGPDAVITVKVVYDGAVRRAKMLLREMVPRVLEDQIRTFLHIPADVETIIERYSDSAASYVVLEPGNMAVYKQLYRAAKAKSKLKLRVVRKYPEDKTVPKPASVEDEADPSITSTASTVQKTPTETTEKPAPPTAEQTTLPVRPAHRATLYNPSSQNEQLSKIFEAYARQDTAEARRARTDSRYNQMHALMQRTAELSSELAGLQSSAAGAKFAVCCNSCDKRVPDAHYHCSTCAGGDFDLCQSCVNLGITCYSNDHWLIKRTMVNGQVINSTTETIAPKPKAKRQGPNGEIPLCRPIISSPKIEAPTIRPVAVPVTCTRGPVAPASAPKSAAGSIRSFGRFANMRTCNCCVEELPSREFLHCTACEDYDLCQSCFAKGGHGHHPKHAFTPAVAGTPMPEHIRVKLAPGRNQMHQAICDGCDKYITGVRHKCLDCPDWDYCADCIVNAGFVHANHRFVPVYEPLKDVPVCAASAPIHHGICCDGPLCSIGKGYPAYIRGVRYKCAVCHDLDFCANCEASPANEHNKTHPLIKFKTAVRHVSVTTTGEHQSGRRMPTMGDRPTPDVKTSETAKSTESNSINAVQTVVDVKPAESEETPVVEPKKEENAEEELRAVFVKDTIADGTILPPNHVFEQTWTLRNESEVAWPAGCSIKFVGGDYMGHVDSTHPAGISELVSASESTVCYSALAPGQEFSFTVLLRTPARLGKFISYWRLTTQDGMKFGHRLWCEVNVRAAESIAPVKVEDEEEEPEVKEEETESTSESTMIFPKLEKESPSSSVHESLPTKPSQVEEKAAESDEFEECAEDDEWDASDDGFLTDEEYDILDASDEEFLEQQEKQNNSKQ